MIPFRAPESFSGVMSLCPLSYIEEQITSGGLDHLVVFVEDQAVVQVIFPCPLSSDNVEKCITALDRREQIPRLLMVPEYVHM